MLVTVSCLNEPIGAVNLGFGNRLFQYAYARAYAESIGAELHTPNWIGRELFKGVDEPIMSGPGDIDLVDYFQQPEHLQLLSRKKLKEWFTFKNPLEIPKHKLIFHKRRGDYLNYPDFWAVVGDNSYEAAAKEIGLNPAEALVLDDSRGKDYMLTDFFLLMNCEVLFRANSTFSFWAGVLGDCQVYSPEVGDLSGWIEAPFVKGNNQGICRDVRSLVIPD
jgi:hypothetical protein